MKNKNIHREFLIATLVFANLAVGQTLTADTQYKKALELNKSARYVESAEILKSLMISYPEVERYKSDFISVASNAKRCDEVIALNNHNYLVKAPAYVQDAIFSCFSYTKNFAQIDALAKSILNRQGKNEAIELRMTSLARDNKEFDAALYWSARLLKDYPDSISAWKLRAGALQDVGDQFAALQIYEDVSRVQPRNPDTQEQIIQVLLDMGIPHLALDLINNKQWNANQNQKLRAIHDSGSVDLRWAQADSAVAPNRFTSLDIGIETLNKALSYAKSIQAPKDQVASIQYDLIIAYTRRKQWDTALALYDKLIADGNTIPDYALSAVAASYSAKHQYAKAGNILQQLYAKKPDDLDIELDLYFNLVDQDQFAQAKLMLDKINSQLKVRPKYLRKRGFDYTSAVIETVSFEAYQEKYQSANQKLIPLLGTIPSNADLLKTAASLRESQGMHEAAADYYQIAAKQDPEDIEATVGYANSRMSQGDIRTFISTVNELQPDYSDITAVKNAAKRLEIYQEGYVTGNFVLGNGDYGSQKNNNRTSDLRVYSAPINDNVRGFARYRDLNSGPAIPVTDQGVGGGLRYTGINQEAEVELGSAGYARIEGTQTLNDNWAVGASYERNAFYLFPGSLYATYGGNVGGLDLRWKDGDTRSAAIGYRYWVLPSNNRQQIFGTASQRLLTEFNYKLDISGYIGNQQNSNSNVSYFSPMNQMEYSSTLNFRLLQWRDVETKKYDFWHRFYGSYGVVSQSSYSTLPMNNYGYGQDFNIGDKRTLSWGVGRTSFPFNGAQSSYITGYLNFESRF